MATRALASSRYVQAHATSAHVRRVAQAHVPPSLRLSRLVSRLLPILLSVPAASAGDRLLSVDGTGAADRLDGLSIGPASAWLALGSSDREATAAAMMGGESLGFARSPKWTLTCMLPAPSTVSSAETAAIATTCKKSPRLPRAFAPPAPPPPPPPPPLGGGISLVDMNGKYQGARGTVKTAPVPVLIPVPRSRCCATAPLGRSNYGGLIDPTFRGAGGVD